MQSHQLKFIRQTIVLYDGEYTKIDIYKCQKCNKICIINAKTDGKISLNNELGEEI